jgi:hypothetical protein
MPSEGVEPSIPHGLRVLSPLRMPFRQKGLLIAVYAPRPSCRMSGDVSLGLPTTGALRGPRPLHPAEDHRVRLHAQLMLTVPVSHTAPST